MTRETTSCSVKMPTSASFSTTRIAPTPCVSISAAAAATLVCAGAVTILAVSFRLPIG